ACFLLLLILILFLFFTCYSFHSADLVLFYSVPLPHLRCFLQRIQRPFSLARTFFFLFLFLIPSPISSWIYYRNRLHHLSNRQPADDTATLFHRSLNQPAGAIIALSRPT
ncbi:hypothetical protein BKA57DRAFT_489905, partial [Linnemannia elongata]